MFYKLKIIYPLIWRFIFSFLIYIYICLFCYLSKLSIYNIINKSLKLESNYNGLNP